MFDLLKLKYSVSKKGNEVGISDITRYIPEPSDDDYAYGFIERYFAIQINNPLRSITEISKTEYNKIVRGTNSIYNAYLLYWKISGESITTDNAIISAPITKLTTNVPGILNQVFVNIGDEVPAYTIVAQVGNELLKTKTASEVVSTLTAMGTTITPGTPVVSVINPDDLRVIAHIDEDKGLSAIHVGQQADFTVDAYGSQKFHGVVDEISPTARQGDIVFNISDKRQINQF